MPLSRLIGSRLRDQRLARGMRQSDVAARAGISASFLNLIEHNRRRVSPAALIRLAQVLACTPDELSGLDEAELTLDLRAVGRGTVAELDRVEEFVLRFPGWAQVLSQMAGQVTLAERAVADLNDRLDHDPYLSQTLHDLLSALSGVRSTAAILVETPDIEVEWQARFHQNLHDDAERMARGAEGLTAYLDGYGGAAATPSGSPQEEVDSWFAAQGWTLAGLESGDVAGVLAQTDRLPSSAGRSMARALAAQLAADVAALPLADVVAALAAHGPDPLRIAALLGADPMAVFRRIATLPGSDLGLVVCDGAGALVYRKPARGFSVPRVGAACALWPLFTALRRPLVGVERRVGVMGRMGEARFVLRAYAEPVRAAAFGGPERCEAAMLIIPDTSALRDGTVSGVGMSCRICVQAECEARREPSILLG